MDAVNHPSHYKGTVDELTGLVRDALLDGDVDIINIECFEALVSMLSIEEIRGYLRGNSFKYRWRYQKKAGVQDLEKASWYERKLLKMEKTIKEYFKEKSNELR